MKAGPIVRETSYRRPGFKRQLVMALVVLGAICAILLVAYFFLLPKRERYTLESYTWSEVGRKDLQETLLVEGTLDFEDTGALLSPEPGYVADIFVQAGDTVGKGQILITIAPQGLEDTLADLLVSRDKQSRDLEKNALLREIGVEGSAQRRARLQKELEDAQAALKKTQGLHAAGYGSAAQLSDAEKAVENAQSAIADLDAAEKSEAIRYSYDEKDLESDIRLLDSRIEKLRLRIAACTIRSGTQGRVMKVDVERGGLVAQYAPLMMVSDVSKPVLRVGIPQNTQDRVALRQDAVIVLGDKRFRGVVEAKDFLAEQNASSAQATVGVRIAFVDIPEEVVPGSTTSAEILLGVKNNTLFLPRGAYLTTGGGLSLYKITGEKARKTEVTFGVSTSSEVEILSGVEEGDRVVTSSYQDFIDYKEIYLKQGAGAGK